MLMGPLKLGHRRGFNRIVLFDARRQCSFFVANEHILTSPEGWLDRVAQEPARAIDFPSRIRIPIRSAPPSSARKPAS